MTHRGVAGPRLSGASPQLTPQQLNHARKLIDKGIAHCAKKLGEEAVETALAAVTEDREHLIGETADLLYHLLVVLEAFASGLPVLTTDVGACRELIEGRTEQDRALGAAGAVVPIASPEATAAAALALLRDDARWQAAQRAAVGRAQAHYRQDQMIEAYRQIYAEAFAWPA